MIGKGKFKVHFTVILMAFAAIADGRIHELGLAFIFVTLHELGHIAAGVYVGANLDEFVVTPIGQRAVLKNLDNLCISKRLFIIAAGPCISFALAVFFKLISLKFIGCLYLYKINLVIAIFNVLPFMPLDGGNFIFQVMQKKIGVLNWARIHIKMGNVFSIVLMVAGVFQVVLYPFNISALIMGIYISVFNKREYANVVFRFYRTISGCETREMYGVYKDVRVFMTDKNEIIAQVLKRLSWDYYYIIVFLKNGNMQFIAQDMLIKSASARGMHTRLADVEEE